MGEEGKGGFEETGVKSEGGYGNSLSVHKKDVIKQMARSCSPWSLGEEEDLSWVFEKPAQLLR